MQARVQKTERPWLTPNEAAALLMVSPVTVRAWAARGELAAGTTADNVAAICAAGAETCLAKPFSHTQLLDVVGLPASRRVVV